MPVGLQAPGGCRTLMGTVSLKSSCTDTRLGSGVRSQRGVMWDCAIGVLLYYRLRASQLIILSQGDHLIRATLFSNSIITWRNQIRDLKTFFFLTMFCTLLGKRKLCILLYWFQHRRVQKNSRNDWQLLKTCKTVSLISMTLLNIHGSTWTQFLQFDWSH